MKKNLLYAALGFMGLIGTLTIGVVKAEFSQVINITGTNGDIIQSFEQKWDDLELYFVSSTGSISHYTIMDRNMGATEVYNQDYNSPNTGSFGYHYQWGNNYGFAPCIALGSSCVTFPGGEPTTSSKVAIQNTYIPSKYACNIFYYYPGTTYKRQSRYSGDGNNLWGNTTNTKDARKGPCPEGYYIPSDQDLSSIKTTWQNSTINNSNGTQFSLDLLLPFAGRRGFLGYGGYENHGVNGQNIYATLGSSTSCYNLGANSNSIGIGCDSEGPIVAYTLRCYKNTKNPEILTLNTNGGIKSVIAFTGIMGNGNFTALGIPTRSNSTFDGWYDAQVGGNKLEVGSNVVPNIYARWSCNTGYIEINNICVQQYTVTLDANTNGGKINGYNTTGITVIKNSELDLSNYIAVPNNIEYNFIGWSNSSNGTGVLTSNPTITSNKTLYAVFKKNITITYLSGLGVNTIGRDSDTCEIYNNNVNCTIYSPSITLKAGYGTGKWINGKKIVDPGEILTLTGDDIYTAIATPNLDTQYIVNYYQENLSGIYDIVEIYTGAGTTDTQATAEQKIYSGFTFSGNYSENIITGNINGSGYLVLKLYYDRDSYAISFISDDTIIQSGSLKYGATILIPANPTKNGYKFIGWNKEIPSTMPAENLTIKAMWEKLGSSGGGGGRSNKTSSDSEKTTEGQAGSQQPLSPQQASDSSPNREQTIPPLIGGDGEARGGSTQNYTQEFQDAYDFAKEKGITTMPTIQKADMDGKLTRIAMAKMLSQYAMNVLGQKPANIVTPKFNDVTDKQNSDYDDGVSLAYQLGIMGQNMPGNKFRPNDEVTRAEFATALSRMLYHTSDGEYKSTDKYYTNHMKKLVQEKIITNDDAKMKELRGYVMIMLMRSAK